MYEQIMVPLDGSHAAERALTAATEVAAFTGGRIHLTHVVARNSELTDLHSSRSPRRYLNHVASRTMARKRVDVRVGLVSGAINGVTMAEPSNGIIGEVLCDYIRSENIDLVIMTTHGRGGFKRMWLGSVADTMLRSSPATVLLLRSGGVAPKAFLPGIRKILIPVEGTKRDEEMIARVVEFGASKNAEYTLLHVASPTVSFVPALIEDDHERETSRANLERMATTLMGLGYDASVEVVTMPFVAPEILAYSQDNKFDMIAISLGGASRVSRMLMGSVADKVIRGARMPVLACNTSNASAR